MSLQDFIDTALNEVGYEEEYNNKTKYGRWYGTDGVDWCEMFVSWCANEANILTTASSAEVPYVPKKSYCPAVYDWYQENRRCLAPNMNESSPNRLRPGDTVIIDNSGAGTNKNHTGIVVDVDYAAKKAVVVEGNYSDKVSKVTYTNLKSNNNSAVISYLCSNHVSY